MKKLAIVLAVVLLAAFVMPGCALIDWIAPEPVPDPEPVPAMKANVDAVLVEDEGDFGVAWSIENVGDLNIFKYVITFNVSYPMLEKDNVILEVTGYALAIGEKDEGLLELLEYDTPETVSCSWKLFN